MKVPKVSPISTFPEGETQHWFSQICSQEYFTDIQPPTCRTSSSLHVWLCDGWCRRRSSDQDRPQPCPQEIHRPTRKAGLWVVLSFSELLLCICCCARHRRHIAEQKISPTSPLVWFSLVIICPGPCYGLSLPLVHPPQKHQNVLHFKKKLTSDFIWKKFSNLQTI